MLAGCVYFVNLRYDFFRLRELELTPSGVVPYYAVWESMPQSVESFWPSMLWRAYDLVKKVESFYPVDISVRPVGWGRCSVTVKPLEVSLYVSWNSRIWMLSPSGKMWLADLPVNAIVKGLELPDRPILAWDSTQPLPIDPDRQGGDIYASSIAMDKVERWYAALDQTGWNEHIYCVIAKRIDGRPVVQILFGTEGNVTSELVLNDDTSNWLQLASAMKELFPNEEYLQSPGVVINATYADMRFTVTEKGASRR